MGHSHTDFYRRIGRIAHMKRSQRTPVRQNKSPRMERNERITAMLVRQEAFAKGLPEPQYEPFDQPTAWMSYLSIGLALAMGALAAILAQFFHYHLTNTIGQTFSVDLDLVILITFAIAIAFLMREMVSLSAVRKMGAQFAGILLTIVTMHNAVHQYPETFSRLFSVEWVSHITQTTEQGTLMFRGHSYQI